MLASSGVGLPNDIWVPSTDSVPPQNSRQWTLGMIRRIHGSNMKLTAEVFYKASDNLIESFPGTNYLLLSNDNWERSIFMGGTGEAYGLETMLELKKGKLDGWLSYTLQNNMRKFDVINEGNWFPSRYDRRHNLSLVGNYTYSEKWNLNWVWTYSSGHAVTVPVTVINTPEGNFIPVFTERNNHRMPDFHRLDVGASRRWKSSKRQRDKEFSFGVYNLYNRVNPLYLDFDIQQALVDGSAVTTEIRIIRRGGIPILPYFNYAVKF